jgi:hypothetical protein
MKIKGVQLAGLVTTVPTGISHKGVARFRDFGFGNKTVDIPPSVPRKPMTSWDIINPDADTWFAMFRGTIGEIEQFGMSSMIAAWTNIEAANAQFDSYIQWELRGGRDGICVIVQYPVSDQFDIRMKTIQSSKSSQQILDYHKPWWDFEIARNEGTVEESGE